MTYYYDYFANPRFNFVIILLRSQVSHNIQYQMYEKRMFTRASRSNFQRGITEADNREHRIDREIEGGRNKEKGTEKIRFMNLFSDRQNRLSSGQFICRATERKECRPQTRKSFRLQSWPKKRLLQMQQCSLAES